MNLGEVVAFYSGYIINCNMYPRGLDRYLQLNIFSRKDKIKIKIINRFYIDVLCIIKRVI